MRHLSRGKAYVYSIYNALSAYLHLITCVDATPKRQTSFIDLEEFINRGVLSYFIPFVQLLTNPILITRTYICMIVVCCLPMGYKSLI